MKWRFLMKRMWDIEEVVEHFTLLPSDLELLANKTGATRLGFALLLKCFQYEARFPLIKNDIPKPIVDYIAHHLDRLTVVVLARFRELHLVPPTVDRVERLVRSACRSYEQTFFTDTLSKLSPMTCERFDTLLASSTEAGEHDGEESSEITDADQRGSHIAEILLQELKANPGSVGLESILKEIAKLRSLEHFALPSDLFDSISPKVLSPYRQRAAAEPPRELRRHPEATRHTLLAAFCWQRRQEVTDSLVELLLLIVHKIGAKAEKQVSKELLDDLRGPQGKDRLLYLLADAALEKPESTIRDGLYPVVSEQKLKEVVKAYKAKGTQYREQVHTRMRASYRNHYRRMVPLLVNMLDIRSNNEAHRPVARAMVLLKRYAQTNHVYYPSEEEVPIEGVVRPMWRELIVEKDKDGETRVNRVNYELCVLEALREKLRCRELWVVGAGKYGNPDNDLPHDFDAQRPLYYQALGQPLDANAFVSALQQKMMAALEAFDQTVPNNPKVKLLTKKGGWIALSPLEPQAEPKNLARLKAEITKRWPMTSLLDLLKETNVRVDFTKHFKSSASRETLERDTLQKRLLLCLYGIGTNTGLKRISTGDDEQGYNELLYVRSRFLHKEQLRNAIADVANATFRIRQTKIWGEATTTCASDSKQFGSWSQNLMTEWHVRYGGRGVMIYWHVEKHSTCIYSQLKTCSSSEVAAMIEGVLRHCTDMTVKSQFVDSHGQSEVAFGFCHLLGFQLMPRLKNIHAQKLYRPQAGTPDAYPNLQLILTRPINWDLIRQQYDQK